MPKIDNISNVAENITQVTLGNFSKLFHAVE